MKEIKRLDEAVRKDELRLMIQVARLYYLEGWLQKRISTELGLSPAKVSNLITKALDEGLVEIRIHDPYFEISTLEQEMKETFGLSHVVVVPGPFADENSLKAKLGLHAALYVQRILRSDHTVGISGGSSLYAMVNSDVFNTYIPVRVVPIIGGVSAAEYNYTSNGLAAMLAHKMGGTYLQVPFPTFVESPLTREAVMKDASASTTLDVARKSDMMILGVGTLTASVLTLPHINDNDIRILREKRAVAEIGGHFLDQDGVPCAKEFDERLIGVSLDDIRNVPRVVAVAGGQEKMKAIVAVLKSGVVNVIVIDEPTARMIMEQQK